MGLEEVVKYLLSHGVSPNVKDTAGRNAIGEAKTKGYANIVRILEAAAAPAQQ
jgi:ankyrin repeat protein